MDMIALLCDAIVRGEENVFPGMDDGTGCVRYILCTRSG